MPTTQLLGSVGHVGSTWNTGMPADFAGLCAAPGSTQRPTMAITISPSHAHGIVVFRIHAPFIKARGATTLESIYLPVFGVGARDCTHSPAQTTRWPAWRAEFDRPSRIESVCMKTFLNARLRAFAASAGQAALLLTLVSSAAQAQINAGELKQQPDLPFTMTQVATFKLPWRVAFLPDEHTLTTEKVG